MSHSFPYSYQRKLLPFEQVGWYDSREIVNASIPVGSILSSGGISFCPNSQPCIYKKNIKHVITRTRKWNWNSKDIKLYSTVRLLLSTYREFILIIIQPLPCRFLATRSPLYNEFLQGDKVPRRRVAGAPVHLEIDSELPKEQYLFYLAETEQEHGRVFCSKKRSFYSCTYFKTLPVKFGNQKPTMSLP